MERGKKAYTAPTITEVKFEDRNLVMFLSCSKNNRIEGAVTNGCCELAPEMEPSRAFDPS